MKDPVLVPCTPGYVWGRGSRRSYYGCCRKPVHWRIELFLSAFLANGMAFKCDGAVKNKQFCMKTERRGYIAKMLMMWTLQSWIVFNWDLFYRFLPNNNFAPFSTRWCGDDGVERPCSWEGSGVWIQILNFPSFVLYAFWEETFKDSGEQN